jgi:ribosomal protein L19E
MDTPKPIDVNMLKGILGNAKKIMNKVDTGDYSTGNVDGRALTEDGVKQLQAEGVRRPMQQTGYNENRIKQSRLPESVKQMMIENPIPQPMGINHTFNLEDVYDEHDEKPLPTPQPRTRAVNEQYQQQPQTTIGHQQQFAGYSENVLRAMMKDVLIEYLTNDYSKNLTENVIKQTINTLIKEGKITTKKRV